MTLREAGTDPQWIEEQTEMAEVKQFAPRHTINDTKVSAWVYLRNLQRQWERENTEKTLPQP